MTAPRPIPALLLLTLALGAAGCGEPTREEQVDRHLRAALSVRLREVALVDALALIAGASGTYLRASEDGALTFS